MELLSYRSPAPFVSMRIPRSYVQRHQVMQFPVPFRVPGGMSGTASTASATLTIAGAGLMKAAALAGPVAGPFVAAAGAIALLGGQIVSMFGGCGATCTQATEYANQAGDLVQQINDTYFAQSPRYRSVQLHALDALKQSFDALAQACGNPQLGSAGQRCISERIVRGGTAPWCPNPGHTGCDWYTTIYDKIANDPDVQPDPDWLTAALNGSGVATPGAPGSSDYTWLLLGGALVLLLVVAL